MDYQQFEKIILNLESCREKSHQLYSLGVDTINYIEPYQEIISILLFSVFGLEGKDWIDWYLYERPSFSGKEPLKAFDENNNEICHNIQSLWETIKEHINEKNN